MHWPYSGCSQNTPPNQQKLSSHVLLLVIQASKQSCKHWVSWGLFGTCACEAGAGKKASRRKRKVKYFMKTTINKPQTRRAICLIEHGNQGWRLGENCRPEKRCLCRLIMLNMSRAGLGRYWGRKRANIRRTAL